MRPCARIRRATGAIGAHPRTRRGSIPGDCRAAFCHSEALAAYTRELCRAAGVIAPAALRVRLSPAPLLVALGFRNILPRIHPADDRVRRRFSRFRAGSPAVYTPARVQTIRLFRFTPIERQFASKWPV